MRRASDKPRVERADNDGALDLNTHSGTVLKAGAGGPLTGAVAPFSVSRVGTSDSQSQTFVPLSTPERDPKRSSGLPDGGTAKRGVSAWDSVASPNDVSTIQVDESGSEPLSQSQAPCATAAVNTVESTKAVFPVSADRHPAAAEVSRKIPGSVPPSHTLWPPTPRPVATLAAAQKTVTDGSSAGQLRIPKPPALNFGIPAPPRPQVGEAAKEPAGHCAAAPQSRASLTLNIRPLAMKQESGGVTSVAAIFQSALRPFAVVDEVTNAWADSESDDDSNDDDDSGERSGCETDCCTKTYSVTKSTVTHRRHRSTRHCVFQDPSDLESTLLEDATGATELMHTRDTDGTLLASNTTVAESRHCKDSVQPAVLKETARPPLAPSRDNADNVDLDELHAATYNGSGRFEARQARSALQRHLRARVRRLDDVMADDADVESAMASFQNQRRLSNLPLDRLQATQRASTGMAVSPESPLGDRAVPSAEVDTPSRDTVHRRTERRVFRTDSRSPCNDGTPMSRQARDSPSSPLSAQQRADEREDTLRRPSLSLREALPPHPLPSFARVPPGASSSAGADGTNELTLTLGNSRWTSHSVTSQCRPSSAPSSFCGHPLQTRSAQSTSLSAGRASPSSSCGTQRGGAGTGSSSERRGGRRRGGRVGMSANSRRSPVSTEMAARHSAMRSGASATAESLGQSFGRHREFAARKSQRDNGTRTSHCGLPATVSRGSSDWLEYGSYGHTAFARAGSGAVFASGALNSSTSTTSLSQGTCQLGNQLFTAGSRKSVGSLLTLSMDPRLGSLPSSDCSSVF